MSSIQLLYASLTNTKKVCSEVSKIVTGAKLQKVPNVPAFPWLDRSKTPQDCRIFSLSLQILRPTLRRRKSGTHCWPMKLLPQTANQKSTKRGVTRNLLYGEQDIIIFGQVRRNGCSFRDSVCPKRTKHKIIQGATQKSWLMGNKLSKCCCGLSSRHAEGQFVKQLRQIRNLFDCSDGCFEKCLEEI